MITLIQATQQDAPAISAIFAAGWRFAFADRINRNYLDSITDTHWVEALQTWLLADVKALVAQADGAIAGAIVYGPSRESQKSDYAEIIALYLYPQFVRRGVGSALMREALDQLKTAGFTRCYLHVLDTNERAQAFYRTFGFSPTGETICVTKTGDALVNECWARKL